VTCKIVDRKYICAIIRVSIKNGGIE